MARRKANQSQRPKSDRGQDLRAIYAKSRAEFSAADLQRFTEIEPGIPLEKVIAKMEAIQRNRRRRTA